MYSSLQGLCRYIEERIYIWKEIISQRSSRNSRCHLFLVASLVVSDTFLRDAFLRDAFLCDVLLREAFLCDAFLRDAFLRDASRETCFDCCLSA